MISLEARGGGGAQAPSPGRRMQTWRWRIVGALSVTETVSYGILYYAFAAFLVPMQRDLGFSAAQLTGAFSLSLLVAAGVGIVVGRHLDRHAPRAVMTGGSLAGVLLVLAWSRVESLTAFYAVWVAIGVVMAMVLYEVAFTVLAKAFPEPGERRRAMTAMTLVAALASFIFLPLSQWLIDAYGWRDALVVLAVVLGVTTVPLHAIALRVPPEETLPPAHAGAMATPAREALRSRPFWLLSIAFFLASLAAIAMVVFSIPFLLERGHGAAFAAFAVGLVGLSQVPGRVLFGPIMTRLPRPQAIAAVFLLIAAGVALVVSVDATWAVVAGLVLLGMGNGMSTLARATAIADLYGAGAYGTIGAVAASMSTTARAGGPIAAAVLAAAAGYEALLWTLAAIAVLAAGLAYRAEAEAG